MVIVCILFWLLSRSCSHKDVPVVHSWKPENELTDFHVGLCRVSSSVWQLSCVSPWDDLARVVLQLRGLSNMVLRVSIVLRNL